jgi:hypothetical protein
MFAPKFSSAPPELLCAPRLLYAPSILLCAPPRIFTHITLLQNHWLFMQCYFENHFIGNHKRATVVSHTTLVKPLSHTYGFSYNIYVKLNMNILLETIRELLWFHIQH